MDTSINVVLKSGFARIILSLFLKKQETSRKCIKDCNVADVVTKEIDALWEMVKSQKSEDQGNPATDCSNKILESFNKLRNRFSDEELDKAYTWLRFVKVALYCENPPINALIEYVNSKNYIFLTKRLTDLTKSIFKGTDQTAIHNSELFYEAVCHHILEEINSEDIPSWLALGRSAQRKKKYTEARRWFSKIIETNEPFNGITALLACYEDETKELLSRDRNKAVLDPKRMEKVRELNDCQNAIYEHWRTIMEKNIDNDDKVSIQYKKEYVSLLTGYARFERNRGNYEKAFNLLENIPNTFPDMYRVYTEEAMLYQFKPGRNHYYSADKAIETFQKAYTVICDENINDASSVKSKKSILMPLANTYFRTGRYNEAVRVCDSVLRIDNNEQRAIKLKSQIACLAS